MDAQRKTIQKIRIQQKKDGISKDLCCKNACNVLDLEETAPNNNKIVHNIIIDSELQETKKKKKN